MRNTMNMPTPSALSVQIAAGSHSFILSAARLTKHSSVWIAAVFSLVAFQRASAADFAVTMASGSAYAFNGTGSNPTLTLIRGQTYSFSVSTPGNHPFRIVNPPAGTTTGNNTSSGTITFTVPTNAANYTYDCSIHRFGGQIVTIAPPTIRIVDLQDGPGIVLKSTGTTNWILAPQYSTNLASTNWYALTVQSNRFVNGTNETFCGRPPGTNVFFRVEARRN